MKGTEGCRWDEQDERDLSKGDLSKRESEAAEAEQQQQQQQQQTQPICQSTL